MYNRDDETSMVVKPGTAILLAGWCVYMYVCVCVSEWVSERESVLSNECMNL